MSITEPILSLFPKTHTHWKLKAIQLRYLSPKESQMKRLGNDKR